MGLAGRHRPLCPHGRRRDGRHPSGHIVARKPLFPIGRARRHGRPALCHRDVAGAGANLPRMPSLPPTSGWERRQSLKTPFRQHLEEISSK